MKILHVEGEGLPFGALYGVQEYMSPENLLCWVWPSDLEAIGGDRIDAFRCRFSCYTVCRKVCGFGRWVSRCAFQNHYDLDLLLAELTRREAVQRARFVYRVRHGPREVYEVPNIVALSLPSAWVERGKQKSP